MKIVKIEVNVDKDDAERFYEKKLRDDDVKLLAQSMLGRYWGAEWFEPEFFEENGKIKKCCFCGFDYKIDKTGRSICDCNKNIAKF